MDFLKIEALLNSILLSNISIKFILVIQDGVIDLFCSQTAEHAETAELFFKIYQGQLVATQPQSLEGTKKHKEYNMNLINSASGCKVCFVLKHHNLKIEQHCFWVVTSWLGVFVAKIDQAD